MAKAKKSNATKAQKKAPSKKKAAVKKAAPKKKKVAVPVKVEKISPKVEPEAAVASPVEESIPEAPAKEESVQKTAPSQPAPFDHKANRGRRIHAVINGVKWYAVPSVIDRLQKEAEKNS